MKIFVTGGTGFIGSNFINQAIRCGHEVIAVKRKESIPRVQTSDKVTWVEGKLDADFSLNLVGCEVFVHLASYGVIDGSNDMDKCFYWNVHSTYKLIEQARISGVNKFIIIGSCFEYGMSADKYEYIPTTAPLEPVTSYGASKAAASVLLHGWAVQNDLSLKILRVFHVYGNGEDGRRLWPSLRRAALSGKDFEMTQGEQVRDFIDVDILAQKIESSLEFSSVEKGRPLIENIGSNNPQSVYEFCRYWWEKWNASGIIKVGEIPYRKNEIMRLVPKVDAN